MPSAAQKVFGITELAELVLGFLPPKQLLQAQGTCRHFQATVHESNDLQRKLFLRRPRRAHAQRPVQRNNDSQPLLINTMLLSSPFDRNQHKHRSTATPARLDLRLLPAEVRSSYQSMYLTQPAAKAVRVVWTFGDPMSRMQYEDDVIENANGVTFGQITASFMEARKVSHPLLLFDEPVLEYCSVEILEI